MDLLANPDPSLANLGIRVWPQRLGSGRHA